MQVPIIFFHKGNQEELGTEGDYPLRFRKIPADGSSNLPGAINQRTKRVEPMKIEKDWKLLSYVVSE